MPDLFGVDFKEEIRAAFAGQLVPLTLTVRTPGTRTPGALTAGTNPDETAVAGEGFLDSYREGQIDGTRIQTGDRKVLIIAGTIGTNVPKPSDRITIESQTYSVVRVDRDPAEATYTCQVRN